MESDTDNRYSCIHDGLKELEDVCDEVALLNLSEIERETDTCLVIDEESGTQFIKTKLRLCQIKYCEGCSNLHLCKRYLFGECPYNDKRNECQFSHDLYSEHNVNVLYQHKLLELDCSELLITLLQNDTTLLPSVCLAYNKGSGEFGNCLEAETCDKLHVCENYIRGICDGCSRCHDLYEPHPFKTLQDTGVSNELMDTLLSVYKNMLTIADIHQPIAPEKWICLFHFQNSCSFENICENVHFCLPYKWEQWDGKSWKVLPDNEEIERAFCDPTQTHSDNVIPVHFDTMTRGSVFVRRLSTISSVLDPSFALTTKWIWYWEDEYGNWIQYGSPQGTHDISSITSDFLEWKYQENNGAVIKFTTAEHSCEVNLQDMIQYNTQSSTKMRIRRRPMFLSAEDVQKVITREKDHWQNPQALLYDSDQANMSVIGFKRVLLNSDTDEYKKIAERFYQTMLECTVKRIEKVLNEDLWEVFHSHVSAMKQKKGGKEDEKLLFHGTESKLIDTICQQNVDWTMCEPHETAFGKGSYFTRDARSSHSYTDKSGTDKCMFLCRVFIGEYSNGHPSYIHPPLKDGETDVFYDSCVNDINNPSIFVVFEKHQVYPEYLIQYEQGAGSSPQHVSLNQFPSSTQASFSGPSVSSQLSPNTALMIAPKFHYTPVLQSHIFAHSKNKYFQAGAARLPFPHHNKPTVVRTFTVNSPTKRYGSPRGSGSMHSPAKAITHTRTSGSFRKDRAKQQVTNSLMSASESLPKALSTTLTTITTTKLSKTVKTVRQQTSSADGGLISVNSSVNSTSVTKTSKSFKAQNASYPASNAIKLNSGLSPGASSAGTSTYTDASKSVRNENSKAKKVSSFSSRPRISPDMVSTKPAGESSKSSASQSTKPAGESSKSSASQSTKPAGESSKSSASQSTKPEGKISKSSASQSTKPASESSKSSASQSTKPEGKISKSSASQSTKPASESSKSSASQSTKPEGKISKSSASQSTKPASESSKSSASQRTKPAGKISKSSASQSTKPAGKSSKSSTGRR
ncbi:protein mono-ADP-ribosyltransferase PARP12-like [Hemibagrus wyckioides]|uniref:protein mono-ADP-ribosyltransferase PARP12-like n=1 Tax=Hemibagrus wyckioides TaxID=337641 RepID=UPI00266C709E|nr:protein mono-ADP-ribosyltransferase PARP12-like [Hemibagrus wyckioides]